MPPLGQFLNIDQIVPEHEQEQIEADILQQKQRSKKSSPSKNSPSSRNSPKNKKRSKRESSDIQRVMYKGQMIDVEDPSEQLIFAFMCQIAMTRPCVDEGKEK